jgi:hypothetical protein
MQSHAWTYNERENLNSVIYIAYRLRFNDLLMTAPQVNLRIKITTALLQEF